MFVRTREDTQNLHFAVICLPGNFLLPCNIKHVCLTWHFGAINNINNKKNVFDDTFASCAYVVRCEHDFLAFCVTEGSELANWTLFCFRQVS